VADDESYPDTDTHTDEEMSNSTTEIAVGFAHDDDK